MHFKIFLVFLYDYEMNAQNSYHRTSVRKTWLVSQSVIFYLHRAFNAQLATQMSVLTVTGVDQRVCLTHTCVKVNFSVWVKRVPFVRTSPPADAPPNDCSNSARSEVERWAP